MPFAEAGAIDPHRIYFETHGTGPQKVLMIMGFGCPARGMCMIFSQPELIIK